MVIDTPFTLTRLNFLADGRLMLFNQGAATRTVSFEIGPTLRLRLAGDLATGQWSVSIDGTQVHTGPFVGDFIRSVRFTMRDYEGGGVAEVYLDDVRIVPEPSTAVLVGVVGTVAAALRRRSARRRRRWHGAVYGHAGASGRRVGDPISAR